MKKILFAVCLVLIMASFIYPIKNKTLKAPLPSGNRTLNGIDGSLAKTMIANFDIDRMKDVGLKSVSEWYSKNDLINMLKVLNDTDEEKIENGVRFYMGEGSKDSTKINVKLLLVTTKYQTPSPPTSTHDGTSKYGDYYDHNPALIPQTEIGYPANDGAEITYNQGSLMHWEYAPTDPDPCPTPTSHDVKISVAYKWIQKRQYNVYGSANDSRDKLGYNTRSECFDICFIQSLFTAIVNDTTLDGLRVYLGEGRTSQFPKVDRDVFILVPTHVSGAYHQDDFKCLPLCRATTSVEMKELNFDTSKVKTITNIQNFIKNNIEPNTSKLNKGKAKGKQQENANYPMQIRKYNATYYMTVPGTVYDNSELCPNVCN